MFSFGATVFLVFVLYDLETAQPKNIFFGHIISMLVGVIFNETLGFSFYSLGLSVGVAVTLMVYLKVMHPPAASNPLVALFMDLSFDFILFPVIGFLFVFLISRFVGLSTISAFFILFLQTFFIDHGIHHNLHAFSLLIFIFILYTHRTNIESMYKGSEAKL